MLERPRRSVNCPNGQVFPIRNSEAGGSTPISTSANLRARSTLFSRKRVKEILQAFQLALMPLGSGPWGIQIQTSHSSAKLEIKLEAELNDPVRFANGDHRCRGRQRS
jgi:hypothetical protein